jgi:hypothetical protein
MFSVNSNIFDILSAKSVETGISDENAIILSGTPCCIVIEFPRYVELGLRRLVGTTM